MLPRGFEQIQCSHGVHFKIQQGNVPGLVVRRLRRAMHDQVELLRSKEFFDRGAVSNIQRRVREAFGCALQPFQVPQRVSRRTEEFAAHVVVHAGHFMALPVKMFHGFRADQTAASRNEYLHVSQSPAKEDSSTPSVFLAAARNLAQTTAITLAIAPPLLLRLVIRSVSSTHPAPSSRTRYGGNWARGLLSNRLRLRPQQRAGLCGPALFFVLWSHAALS